MRIHKIFFQLGEQRLIESGLVTNLGGPGELMELLR